MNQRYLQITFRDGRPVAAYYTLPRAVGTRSHRVREFEEGIVVDFAADDSPIGVEITAPVEVSLAGINRVLVSLGQPEMSAEEFAPLGSAA